MIFISHNSKDKPIIDPIATRLSEIFGRDNVFYDSWSMQPGDSLIGRMDEGLKGCKFFLLFISNNSLNSEMVKLEWRNALIKSTKGETRIVPIRLEKIEMPAILTDTLFIDTANLSMEDVIRQITDVVNGKNTYRDDKPNTGFHNVVTYRRKDGDDIELEFRAQQFSEPIAKYIILVENTKDEVEYACPDEGIYESGFTENLSLNSGQKVNAILVGRDRALMPGFPLRAIVKKKGAAELKIVGVMKPETQNSWRGVPLLDRE